jgi:hypothetical protein
MDIVRYVSLHHDQELSALAREHSIIGEPATSFGFTARSETTRFFLMPTLSRVVEHFLE